MSDKTIAQLGSRYHEFVRAHPHADSAFAADIEDLLSDAGVTVDRVTARIKSWPSLKAKARRRRDDGSRAYPDPWHDVHDIIGVRVNVFHSTEIPVTLDVLAESFKVHRSVDKAAETRIAGGFGYGSHHMILEVPEGRSDLAEYVGMQFEVQVRTVLQHAWAEFEHDVRYKQGGQIDPQVDRAFTLAAGLIELADQQFDQIAALKEKETEGDDYVDDVAITAETLPGILAVLLGNRFPRSRSEHYRWLEELLLANGINTVAELSELLNDSDISKVFRSMRYRFLPGQVRLIDDLLLLRFREEHIERTGNSGNRAEHRPERLKARLNTMRQLGL
ncbi:GTP pyrophosphokinase [Corynebacterium yudongzhengii]|uniref:GTP pyrophosphokinase n=1 Tax=Corynebacterium yudongzhengii TaxID=2080740 RepID=A0A2U1T6I8_9CORY|nr:GTP pyrophosphokinase [Corynebacterium yudongzhengii]AWB81600.1 GTP pyrophosphokinase [Corynebacterium yudongzhengii]PWC01585.1 GTP pyrophosphokinase [Corynebacterium yudongzhengii]